MGIDSAGEIGFVVSIFGMNFRDSVIDADPFVSMIVSSHQVI